MRRADWQTLLRLWAFRSLNLKLSAEPKEEQRDDRSVKKTSKKGEQNSLKLYLLIIMVNHHNQKEYNLFYLTFSSYHNKRSKQLFSA